MGNLINIENKDGQMVVSSREIAINFEKQHKHVLEAIETLTQGVAEKSASLFIPTEYQHEQNKQWYKEYLLTRDGFSLLVMGFTGAKALSWKLKYIEAFNRMEQQLSGGLPNELSPQLQVLINLELSQKQMQQAIDATNQRVDKISDIVALSTTNWREDAKNLISRIALAWGGYDYIREVNREIYDQLNARMGVNLKQRQTNKRDRMAREGVCKSTRDKVTLVDVVSDDKKLIEGYVAIVKEMAIKHGVADDQKGA